MNQDNVKKNQQSRQNDRHNCKMERWVNDLMDNGGLGGGNAGYPPPGFFKESVSKVNDEFKKPNGVSSKCMTKPTR